MANCDVSAEAIAPDLIAACPAWVTARCDPYKDRIPKIPAELIEQTSRVYTQAFETITGKHFVADTSGKTVLDRIRENLKPYF